MIASVALPLLAVALFGLVAPRIARRASPGAAVWMLSLGGLLVALFSAAAVAVVFGIGLAELPWTAHAGHWSVDTVRRDAPFRPWAIVLAGALLTATAVAGARTLVRQARQLRAAWSASRAAPPGLVVLDDPAPVAFAVPGWPGRVVASRGLLRGLDAPGRRALLAHEETHLRERHDLHLAVAAVAAALNPLVGRLPAAVELACERRADQVAAQAVGDPRIVARAIAVAVAPQGGLAVWAAAGADVPLRVHALLTPGSGSRLTGSALAVAAGAVVVASGLSVLWLGHDLRNVIIAARNPWA